jgi:ankyrin repeat protein
VSILLEKGAELETQVKTSGQTPLSYAIEKGHEAIVKPMLEKSAERGAKDQCSRIPLHWVTLYREGRQDGRQTGSYLRRALLTYDNT